MLMFSSYVRHDSVQITPCLLYSALHFLSASLTVQKCMQLGKITKCIWKTHWLVVITHESYGSGSQPGGWDPQGGRK